MVLEFVYSTNFLVKFSNCGFTYFFLFCERFWNAGVDNIGKVVRKLNMEVGLNCSFYIINCWAAIATIQTINYFVGNLSAKSLFILCHDIIDGRTSIAIGETLLNRGWN